MGTVTIRIGFWDPAWYDCSNILGHLQKNIGSYIGPYIVFCCILAAFEVWSGFWGVQGFRLKKFAVEEFAVEDGEAWV